MIRRATIEDNEFLVNEYREFYNDLKSPFLVWPSDEECGRIASSIVRSCICFIAENENGKPCGFMVLVPAAQLLQPKQALVEQTLWVCKDERGKGYCHELLEHAIEVAKDVESVGTLTVTIDPSSTITYNTMKTKGFVKTGVQYALGV